MADYISNVRQKLHERLNYKIVCINMLNYLPNFTFFSPNSPKKLMCMSRRYTSETHQVTTTAIRSEQMCNYDLDDMDLRWLSAVNGERALMGATTISELEMERGIEDFEKQCWEKINITLRNNEAQEDQDDSVICDVCRSVSLRFYN